MFLGDFNRMDTPRLRNNFHLKQIVNFPTCGKRTLDLVLTSLAEYYDAPIQLSPFELSDPNSLEVQPKSRLHMKHTASSIKVWDLCPKIEL